MPKQKEPKIISIRKIKTLEDAYEFIQEHDICTIFSGKVKGVSSLWDTVDLPDRSGGRTKWGARVEAIWRWKNELPETYPDDIFYGKIAGGHAVLMSMKYLKEVHYPKHHKPIEDCAELAQQTFELVRLNSGTTSELRKEAMSLYGCTKSRFDTALKQLQITLNIARSNEPGLNNDTWIPFDELYYEFTEE